MAPIGDPESNADTCQNSTSKSDLKTRVSPSRIAFGSCNHQNREQPLWKIVKSRRPAAFVWGGDAIYADRFAGIDWSTFPPAPIHISATPESLNELYRTQLEHADYKELLDSTNLTVFGSVDDHDYGANNGDKFYQYKRESGMAFVKFTKEPDDSPISKRARKGFGVYGVKLFDFSRPEGDYLVPDHEALIDADMLEDNEERVGEYSSDTSVAIFVLDCRTNKTPWAKGFAAWSRDWQGDFFGEEQWKWFEASLKLSKASINVIVQGLQVHAHRHVPQSMSEEWAKFPNARQRFYQTILDSQVKAPILISGDVHMAQIMRKDCLRESDIQSSKAPSSNGGPNDGSDAPISNFDAANLQLPPTRPLMEVTTSGMTHSWGTYFSPRPEFHNKWHSPYYHASSRSIMSLGHQLCPWTELLISRNHLGKDHGAGEPGAKAGKQYALDLNFGEMEFDWQSRAVQMRIWGKEAEAPPLLSAQWTFDQLSGIKPMSGGPQLVPKEFLEASYRHTYQHHSEDEWVCMNYRGEPSTVQTIGAYAAAFILFMFWIILPYALGFLCLFPGIYCYRSRSSRSAKNKT